MPRSDTADASAEGVADVSDLFDLKFEAYPTGISTTAYYDSIEGVIPDWDVKFAERIGDAIRLGDRSRAEALGRRIAELEDGNESPEQEALAVDALIKRLNAH